eukprot:scaffold18231_cov87-Skeletonema_marinoi.AAC.1
MNPKDTAPQQSDQGAVSVTLPIAGPIAGWLLQSSAIPSDAAWEEMTEVQGLIDEENESRQCWKRCKTTFVGEKRQEG